MAKTHLKWNGREFKKRLHSAMVQALHEIGVYVSGVIVTSFPRGTGGEPSEPGEPPAVQRSNYEDTIDYEVDNGDLVCRIGTNDERGPWLELGTGSRAGYYNSNGDFVSLGGESYVIEAKSGSTLHWKDSDGNDVFAKRVVHPGIHPRPHIVPGVRKSERAINGILQKAVAGMGLK